MQVSPTELENFLLRNPIVADVSVVPILSESSGELPMAFVVKSPAYKDADDKILKETLHSSMKETFSQHKQLAGGIEFVDLLPKSATGKTQRKILKEWAKASAEASKAQAAATVRVFEFDSDSDSDSDSGLDD
jgi:acyl-coenzyme A synthetase/AMP-(fatty) acid ligase